MTAHPEEDDMDAQPLATPVGRRTVLAAAAATGLLAACGSDDEGTSTGEQTPLDAEGSASGEVLAQAAEVPVGGGVINTDEEYVVTQPADGDYRAFSSICPHQQCQVSSVTDNTIRCACHGSQFSAETGDVEAGPAPQGLAEISVTVEGDSIVRS
mgnify:CR=1 FL=1